MLLSIYNRINDANKTMLDQLQEKVVNKLGSPNSIKTWRSRTEMCYNDVTITLDAFYDSYEVCISTSDRAIAWCDNIDEALECLNSYAAA